jgi:hypothetical protein
MAPNMRAVCLPAVSIDTILCTVRLRGSLMRVLHYSPLLDLCESFVCSGRSGWPWAWAKMLEAGGGP